MTLYRFNGYTEEISGAQKINVSENTLVGLKRYMEEKNISRYDLAIRDLLGIGKPK